MNREETLRIMSVLKVAYPQAYSKLTRDDAIAMVQLWQIQFQDIPYEEVNAALMAFISTDTKGFFPPVGAIKEKLVMVTGNEELEEAKAWGLVAKACQNGIYGYRKEFDKLPDPVKEAVGSAEQIRDWAMMDEETFNSVIASNFLRNYRVRAQRHKEVSMLPNSVRNALSETSNLLAFPK